MHSFPPSFYLFIYFSLFYLFSSFSFSFFFFHPPGRRLLFCLYEVSVAPKGSLVITAKKRTWSLLLLSFLGEEHGLDVGQNASLGNGDTGQELVQFLIVADGQLQVTGDNSGLLVVTGSIAGQLQDFCGQVLHDGGQVNWGTGTYALSIVALAQKTVDTTYGELESSPAATGLGLALNFASLATSRHDDADAVASTVATEKFFAKNPANLALYTILHTPHCQQPANWNSSRLNAQGLCLSQPHI